MGIADNMGLSPVVAAAFAFLGIRMLRRQDAEAGSEKTAASR